MNFLVLANSFTGSIIVKRLTEEGHHVYYVNPFHRNNGISAFPSVYRCINNPIDAAIICDTGFTKEKNLLQQKQIPTFGGSQFQEKVELNREIQKQLCKQYKIRWYKTTTRILYPLSTEIWFCNGEPLYQYINYVKQYKFLAGDLGVDVDCESLVMWSNLDRNVEAVNRIFQAGLFDFLLAIKYTGIFSLDAYISKDDKYPYVFNIIPRLQTAPLACMLELYNGKFGDLIVDLLHNKPQSILLSDKIAIGVAVSRPPYPYGEHGLIKYLTASDKDWNVARKTIAAQIKELTFPDIQYRVDGGIQAIHLEDMARSGYYKN